MASYQEQIDSLLERYLLLLDEYTQLRSQLSNLQAAVFRDIARANFSAERGLRYGQDQYDQRMQARKVLKISKDDDEGSPKFEVVTAEAGGDTTVKEEAKTENEKTKKPGEDAKNDDKDEAEQEEVKEKKKAKSKDPLRWFGLLTPQMLRTAQASSIEAVEEIIPRLVSVNEEMALVEIEVRRARKKRAKAEAAAAKDEKSTTTANTDSEAVKAA